jgi:hypothetical protein
MGGYGFMGSEFWSTSATNHWGVSMNILDQALREWSALDGRTEFLNMPFIPIGCSNGGVTAWAVANLLPARTICTTPDEFHSFQPTTMTNGALGVPTLASHADAYPVGASYSPRFRDARGRGALLDWWLQYRHGHCEGPMAEIQMAFWEKCIRARYPQSQNPRTGPVILTPISEASGWAIDTTWRNGLVDTRPYSQYNGPRSAVGWALDEDMAHLLRCMSSWGSLRHMEVSQNGQTLSELWPVLRPGSSVRLRVTDGTNAITGWQRVEFYNGATKLGEVTSGSPVLDVTLATGGLFAQAFSALIFMPGSVIRATDHPKGVLVVDTAVATAAWQHHPRKSNACGAVSVPDLAARWYDVAGRLVSHGTRAQPRGACGVRFARSGDRSTVTAPETSPR